MFGTAWRGMGLSASNETENGTISPFRGSLHRLGVRTLDGVLWRRLTKSHARGGGKQGLDSTADEWRREAAIQELESVMWRVGVLTATAHELVEDMEEPGRKPCASARRAL